MAKHTPLSSLKPAARNKRIAILARNPGTRASIPTKFLPAKYQALRTHNQQVAKENATLYNPAAILSGNDLRGAVKSEVNSQINPQLGAFDRAIQNLGAGRDIAASRLAGYSSLYNAETAKSAGALSTAGSQLVQQLAAAGQTTQNQLGQIQSDISSASKSDEALRGSGLQDFGRAQGAVDFNRAQAAGATNSAIGAAAGQVSGANTLAGTIAAVAPMRANDQQFALAGKFNQQIADMMGKRADVEATRGDLTTKTLNQMRQDQFTNLVTMKGLDLKASDLAETVRSNKAQENIATTAIGQRDAASIRTSNAAHAKRVLDSKQFNRKLANSQAYQQAQIDIKRGIDPVTHKRLPKKPGSAADALNKWKLDYAKKHGYLPSTGAPKGPKGKGKGKDGGPSLTTNEKITQTGKFSPVYNTITQTVKPDFPGDRQTGGVNAGKAFLKDNPAADPLYVSVALDMAYDGHVSKRNAEKLHQRGLTVQDLGLKSATQAVKDRTNRSVVRNTGTKKHRRVGTGAFPPINIAP
jgi:hypothetical protein